MLIRSLDRSLAALGGSALAVGNFDGVHHGHRALVRASPRTVVLTFDPHPRSFFNPEASAFLLTTLDEKVALLKAQGAVAVIALPFDARLAALSAEDFLTKVVAGALAPARMTVGEDFRFGAGRRGDKALIARLAPRLGFEAQIIPLCGDASGALYSSSRVRDLLARGEVSQAAVILGRPYGLAGKVVLGAGRGRGFGIPTANISDFGGKFMPAQGVYAVTATVTAVTATVTAVTAMLDAHESEALARPAIAYLGRCPTLGGRALCLETHIFDFNADLYGKNLRVHFHDFLRPDQEFAGPEDLQAAMREDIAAARRYFAI